MPTEQQQQIQYNKRIITRPTTNPPPIPQSDPQIPSIAQSQSSSSSRSKKKKNNNNFSSSTFRGLGCTASPQVSVPAAIRTAADWEEKNNKKAKGKMKNRSSGSDKNKAAAVLGSQSAAADVCCAPGMGFAADAAASVDCVVVSRRGVGRVKIDGEKANQRERERDREREQRPSCSIRRLVNPEHMSLMESEHSMGRLIHSGFDVFGGSRYHRHMRYPSPEGFAEIMMLQSSLMMGGRSDRFDRHRELRLDVDNMSYEELLELGERIGHVSTGLKEDEIVHCLKKTKPLNSWFSHISTETERKCSICQEEYEGDDEIGKLECGHLYHIDCVKQWLTRRNTCPICKTAAAPQ